MDLSSKLKGYFSLKVHFHHPYRHHFSACGMYQVQRHSNVETVNCLNCQRSSHYLACLLKALNKQRLTESFIADHLNQTFSLRAWVARHDPSHQTLDVLFPHTRAGQFVATRVQVRQWTHLVQPGDLVLFRASCARELLCGQPWPYLFAIACERICRQPWPQRLARQQTSGPKLDPRDAGYWIWSKHAAQRRSERGIPLEAALYTLRHGFAYLEGPTQVYLCPLRADNPWLPAWKALKIIAQGRQIVTLYVDNHLFAPIPQRLSSSA